MCIAYILLFTLCVTSVLVDAASVCSRNGHTASSNDFDHKNQCHLELGTRGKNCKSSDDTEKKAYPDGDYCFQVFSSDGKTALSTSKIEERIFTVANGRIVDIKDNSSHEAVGADGCDSFRLNLEPYTESSDGKYRLYIVSKSKLVNGNFPTSGLPSPILFSAAKGGRTNKGWRKDLYLSSSQKDDLSGSARFSTPHSYSTSSSCGGSSYKDFGSSQSTYFANTFSADVTPLGTGVHTIYLTAIDGARLKIDGSVVIDGWEESSGEELSASIFLDASKTYSFVVEYYTLQGKSSLSLTWSFGNVKKASISSNSASYTAKAVLPTVSVGKKQYCTLEGKHSESNTKTCQKNALSIPDGWELASADDEDALVAVGSYQFGGDCVVFNGGKGIVPVEGSSCGSGLLTTQVKNGKTCHKPKDKSKSFQILLVNKESKSEENDAAVQTKTWKAFGFEWAVLDGTPSGSKTVRSCKTQFYPLPSGWELAPKSTPCTLAAIYGGWGATDIVIDKTAVNSRTGELGSLLALEIKPSAGKSYYRATSVSGKCQRVLIRRKDDSAVLNTQITNVTNFVSVGDKDYATIDNSKINDPVLACQAAPFRLPVGWSLASKPKDSNFLKTIKKSGSFGTTGLVFADGSWISTSSSGSGSLRSFADGSITYYVADCTNVAKKIVIEKDRPKTTTGVPTGAPNAACGTCSATGDPHITNFGGTKATYLGIGEFIYLQPNASTSTAADGSYEIYGRFSPVKTASANSAIFLRWNTETVSIAVPPNSVKTVPTLARNGATIALTLDKVGNGKDNTAGVSITITLTSSTYIFTFPNGIVAKVKAGFWNNNLLDLYVIVPNSLTSKTQGLCGPCGDKSSKAIITSTGKGYTNATKTQTIEWGNSWSKTPVSTTAAPTTAKPSSATTTPAPTSGGCAGDATKTEWTVNFLGSSVNGAGAATSTSFQYSVFTTNTGKSLSHWVLIASIKNVTTSPASVLGTDGSTGYYGIKFETSNTNGKTLQFTVTYPGTCVVQDAVTFIVKGGNACYQALIKGPGLCSFDLPTTASPTTGAPSTSPPEEEVEECDADLLVKAQKACSTDNGVDEQDVDSCIFDVCVFGDVDAAKSHQQKQNEENNQVVNPDTFGDAACVTAVPTLNATVTSKGKTFAVLDFTAPDSDTSGTQTVPLALPAGWVIAEDSPFVRSVITCHSFGTSCLLLANGVGFTKDLQVCGTAALQSTGDCHSPKAKVSARILITQAQTNSDLSLDDDIDLSNGGSTSNGKSDQDETGNGVIVLGDKDGDASVTITRAFSTSSSFSVLFSSKATATGVQADNFVYTASVSTVVGGTTTLVGTVSFDANLNKWHTRSIDVAATAGVTALVFTFDLKNAFKNTRVLFSRKIRITTAGSTYSFGNLLENPTIIGTNGWKAFGAGFSYSNLDNTVGDGSGSLQLTSNNPEQDFGAYQIVPVDDSVTSIYFRADSKVVSTVEGSLGAGYSIYVDVIYEEGVESTWGLNGQFSNLTTEWQSTEKVFKIPQDGRKVKEIQLVALFRKHTGTAVFDNLYLTTMDCDVGNNTGTNTDASSYGDPHLVTLDGVPYDCQRLGDFILYTDDVMTITTRHSAAKDAAVNSITSIKYRSSSVIIERNKKTAYPFVTVNGVPTTATPGQPVVLNDGTLITSGALAPITGVVRYDLDFPSTGHKVIVTAHLGNFNVQWLQVFPKPPRASFGKTGGLLGKYNGDAEDDFTDAFGNSIPRDSDLQTILDSFVETWRVENFVYAVNDMSNFWDPSTAQPEIKTIDDYPADQVQAASKACQGVSQYESCVLDTLMTTDSAYASSYNTMESILRANIVTAQTTAAPTTTATIRNSASSVAVSFVLLMITLLVAVL